MRRCKSVCQVLTTVLKSLVRWQCRKYDWWTKKHEHGPTCCPFAHESCVPNTGQFSRYVTMFRASSEVVEVVNVNVISQVSTPQSGNGNKTYWEVTAGSFIYLRFSRCSEYFKSGFIGALTSYKSRKEGERKGINKHKVNKKGKERKNMRQIETQIVQHSIDK
jgi:hypothetical protein